MVDVDRLWVLIGDTTTGGTLFKSIDIKSKNPLIYYIPNNDPKGNPQGAVWLHNGGGEKWGRMVVPTAQNTFNGGQWAGQNSDQKVRVDGLYPLAIWAQFRTSDNIPYFQGLWIPTSGTLDNRNRVDAWSTTSSQNFFVGYSPIGSNGGSQSLIPSPVTATTTLAKLPAFVVKNAPLTFDLWLGPIESGIKIVSANRLTSLTGIFKYHGDYWNYPIPEFTRDIKYKTIAPTMSGYNWSGVQDNNVILTTGSSLNYPTWPVASRVMARANSSPYKTNDNVLFTGLPPTDAYTNAWLDRLYDTRDDIAGPQTPQMSLVSGFDVNRTGIMARKVLGFTPMAFNESNSTPTLPANATGMIYETQPYYNGPGKYAETVFADINFWTIKPNHDIYISMEMVYWNAPYDTMTNGNGPGSLPEINFAQRLGQYATFNLNIPFRNALAMYITNTIYARSGRTNNIIRSSNIEGIRAATNYVLAASPNFDYFMQDDGDLREPMILARFTLTEAKSGQQYFFTIRGACPLGGYFSASQPGYPGGQFKAPKFVV